MCRELPVQAFVESPIVQFGSFNLETNNDKYCGGESSQSRGASGDKTEKHADKRRRWAGGSTLCCLPRSRAAARERPRISPELHSRRSSRRFMRQAARPAAGESVLQIPLDHYLIPNPYQTAGFEF